MSLRFRKSIKVLPGVKLNLNKNSHSWTFGGKGMHYTVNKKTGKTTQTMDLPGGFSYVETRKMTDDQKDELRFRNKHQDTDTSDEFEYKSPKRSKKKKWIIFILIWLLLGLIVGSCEHAVKGPNVSEIRLILEDTEMKTSNEQEVKIELLPEDHRDTKVELFSSDESVITIGDDGGKIISQNDGTATIYAKSENGIKSDEVEITVINEEVKEPEIDEDLLFDNNVYVSSTGKYHSKPDCSGMTQYTEMTKEEAINAGYVPCKRCY